MKKFYILFVVLIMAGATTFGLCACDGEDVFFEEEYSCSEETKNIVIDIRDKVVDVKPSFDDKVHLQYFQGEKSKYYLTEEDCLLTVTQSETAGISFGKADRTYRTLTIFLPRKITSLSISTTNEDICIAPFGEAEDIALNDNRGNILLENVFVSKNLSITVKNANISGSVAGGWDDFAIMCDVKKGECNLPNLKEGGDKTLKINCNNGDVNITFTAPQ